LNIFDVILQQRGRDTVLPKKGATGSTIKYQVWKQGAACAHAPQNSKGVTTTLILFHVNRNTIHSYGSPSRLLMSPAWSDWPSHWWGETKPQ